MKTYTRHSIAGWDVYTDDETGRVHHLVDPDSNDPRTLYSYIPAAGGGWDNACGSLTLSALRGRMKSDARTRTEALSLLTSR